MRFPQGLSPQSRWSGGRVDDSNLLGLFQRELESERLFEYQGQLYTEDWKNNLLAIMPLKQSHLRQSPHTYENSETSSWHVP